MDEQNSQTPPSESPPAGEAIVVAPLTATPSTDVTPSSTSEPESAPIASGEVPNTAPESQTAQVAESEPLPETTPASTAPAQPEEPQPEPTQTPVQPLPASVPAQAQGSVTANRNIVHVLLEKARAAIQLRKQKKLLKIMTLFAKRTHITNDEVEKLLHVSDATATRYLSHLEQQGIIKQSGKTGKAVRYVKV